MWGIKLKLCRIVSNISFYKSIIFIAVAQALWLLWQLKVSIDLQSEKWKLRFIATSLQIFWQKFYKNVCWVVLHQAYHYSLNLSIWLVAMATERLNLQKNIKPEDNWSCIAHLSAEDMLKSEVIEEKKFTNPGVNAILR